MLVKNFILPAFGVRHVSYHKGILMSTTFSKKRNKMRIAASFSFTDKEIN